MRLPDWCIGSNVPFQLIGKLPSNYADYETYKYVFHDTLGAGLQYNGDVKVYVRNGEKDTELTTGFTVAPDKAATAGGGSLTITFDNLKTITSITSSSSIVVKYTAKLLNTAVIGQPGNPNEVYLEYSSNPNFSGTGTPPTSETPKDTVLVFTYQLDINKVDGTTPTKKLQNAEFKLKCIAAEKEATWNGKWVTVDANNKVTGWADTQGKGSTLITNANGLAQVIGLDAGTYALYETKAPGGYNKLKDPIKIVITATLDKTEDNPALTALTIKVDDSAAEKGDVTKGTVSTTVTNNSGATLPETGGVGTTLLVTALALALGIVLGSVVALVRVAHDQQRPNHRNPVLGFFNAICEVYTTIIRGTPMMVQLLIMSMVIFSNSRNFTMVGALTLGINSGAYVSEIIRGGLMAVDPGQMEAGRSLGLNYITTMVVIIIPQAIRAVLPALGNEFIVLLKDTSLITTIGGKELLYAAQGIMNRTYEAMYPLLGVALIYLLLVMLFTRLLAKFERRLAQSDR